MPLIEEYATKNVEFDKRAMANVNANEASCKLYDKDTKYGEKGCLKSDKDKESVWGPIFKNREHFVEMHFS